MLAIVVSGKRQAVRAGREIRGPALRLDNRPGIRRKKAGNGFTYTRADGSKLSEKDFVKRIRALAIPPAWTEVWICPFADGHIQATGRDAKGRKQRRRRSCAQSAPLSYEAHKLEVRWPAPPVTPIAVGTWQAGEFATRISMTMPETPWTAS